MRRYKRTGHLAVAPHHRCYTRVSVCLSLSLKQKYTYWQARSTINRQKYGYIQAFYPRLASRKQRKSNSAQQYAEKDVVWLWGVFLFCSRLWLTRNKQRHKHGISLDTVASVLKSHFGQLDTEERSKCNVGKG